MQKIASKLIILWIVEQIYRTIYWCLFGFFELKHTKITFSSMASADKKSFTLKKILKASFQNYFFQFQISIWQNSFIKDFLIFKPNLVQFSKCRFAELHKNNFFVCFNVFLRCCAILSLGQIFFNERVAW